MHKNETGVRSIIFSGLINVPESKPPINYITQLESLPILHKAYLKKDKIIFQGILIICLEYIPERPVLDKKILIFKVPFGHFLSFSGESSKPRLTLKAIKEHQEWLLVGKRKLKSYISIQVINKEI